MQKKRWYQLTMSQLLVAVAGAAAVVSLNLPVSRKVGTGRLDDGQELTTFVTEGGWPVLYVAGVWATTTQSWSKQPPDSVDLQDIDFIVLLFDLIVDCALLAAVLWVIHLGLNLILKTARCQFLET